MNESTRLLFSGKTPLAGQAQRPVAKFPPEVSSALFSGNPFPWNTIADAAVCVTKRRFQKGEICVLGGEKQCVV